MSEKLGDKATVELVFEYATRADKVRPSLGQKIAVENAPDSEAGFFKVPKVVER